jgi:hypothetical protein
MENPLWKKLQSNPTYLKYQQEQQQQQQQQQQQGSNNPNPRSDQTTTWEQEENQGSLRQSQAVSEVFSDLTTAGVGEIVAPLADVELYFKFFGDYHNLVNIVNRHCCFSEAKDWYHDFYPKLGQYLNETMGVLKILKKSNKAQRSKGFYLKLSLDKNSQKCTLEKLEEIKIFQTNDLEIIRIVDSNHADNGKKIDTREIYNITTQKGEPIGRFKLKRKAEENETNINKKKKL